MITTPRPLFLFTALALFSLVSGCIVTTEHPLSDPAQAQPDSALVGKWQCISKNQDHSVTRIRFDAHGFGHFEDRKADGQGQSTPHDDPFFVTRTASATYLNCRLTDADHGKIRSKKPLYQFLKYQVSKDGKTLTIWTPKLAAFRQAVREGRLKGRIEKTDLPPKKDGTRDDSLDGTALRDSPATILRFLESRPPAELFDVASVVKKVD